MPTPADPLDSATTDQPSKAATEADANEWEDIQDELVLQRTRLADASGGSSSVADLMQFTSWGTFVDRKMEGQFCRDTLCSNYYVEITVLLAAVVYQLHISTLRIAVRQYEPLVYDALLLGIYCVLLAWLYNIRCIVRKWSGCNAQSWLFRAGRLQYHKLHATLSSMFPTWSATEVGAYAPITSSGASDDVAHNNGGSITGTAHNSGGVGGTSTAGVAVPSCSGPDAFSSPFGKSEQWARTAHTVLLLLAVTMTGVSPSVSALATCQSGLDPRVGALQFPSCASYAAGMVPVEVVGHLLVALGMYAMLLAVNDANVAILIASTFLPVLAINSFLVLQYHGEGAKQGIVNLLLLLGLSATAFYFGARFRWRGLRVYFGSLLLMERQRREDCRKATALAEARENSIRLNTAKAIHDAVASYVAHSLRNPIHRLKYHFQDVLTSHQLSPRANDQASEMRDAINNMDSVLDDMLLHHSLLSGAFQRKDGECNLARCLEAVATATSGRMRSVDYKLGEDVPVSFVHDEPHLGQLLKILVSLRSKSDSFDRAHVEVRRVGPPPPSPASVSVRRQTSEPLTPRSGAGAREDSQNHSGATNGAGASSLNNPTVGGGHTPSHTRRRSHTGTSKGTVALQFIATIDANVAITEEETKWVLGALALKPSLEDARVTMSWQHQLSTVGLGLPVALMLADALGSRLEIRSLPSGYTRIAFIVRVGVDATSYLRTPIVARPVPAARNGASATSRAASGSDNRGLGETHALGGTRLSAGSNAAVTASAARLEHPQTSSFSYGVPAPASQTLLDQGFVAPDIATSTCGADEVSRTLQEDTFEDMCTGGSVGGTGSGVQDVTGSTTTGTSGSSSRAGGAASRPMASSGSGATSACAALMPWRDSMRTISVMTDVSVRHASELSPMVRAIPLQPLLVLIVDDEASNRKLNTRMVTKLGHRAVCVKDGVEVLAAVKSAEERGEPIDLILMDIMMPHMTGTEACQQLRQAGYCLPIIAATANTSGLDIAAYLAQGFTSYLAKPFSLKGLKEAIERIVPQSASDMHGDRTFLKA